MQARLSVPNFFIHPILVAVPEKSLKTAFPDAQYPFTIFSGFAVSMNQYCVGLLEHLWCWRLRASIWRLRT